MLSSISSVAFAFLGTVNQFSRIAAVLRSLG